MLRQILVFLGGGLLLAGAGADAQGVGVSAARYPAYPRCPAVGSGDGPCANLFTPLNPAEYEARDVQAQRLPLKDRGHEATAYFVPDADTRPANLVARPSGGLLAAGGFGFRMMLIDADGLSWHVANHADGGGFLRGITYVDAALAFAAGDNGMMLRSQDGGRRWEMVNRVFRRATDPIRTDLRSDGSAYGIAFADANHGVAVGEDRLWRTQDGGQTWMRAPFVGDRVALQGVHFADAAHGWVVGSSGTVLRTSDAGAHWQAVSVDDDHVHLMDVTFASPQHGCLGGDFKVWCTWDGGAHWQPAVLPLPKALDTSATVGITHLRLLDERRGWLVTRDGWIFASEDGGAHWSAWMHADSAIAGKLQHIELWGLAIADGKMWAAGAADRDTGKGGEDAVSTAPLLLSWKP